MTEKLDLPSVGEAVLDSGLVPRRVVLECLLQLAETDEHDDGEALLPLLVDSGHLSLEAAQTIQAALDDQGDDPNRDPGYGLPLPSRPGSVRHLADQLRMRALPTLVQDDNRSFAIPSEARAGDPTMLERPTNRARRILLETRVAVSAKRRALRARGEESDDDAQPTRLLVAGDTNAASAPVQPERVPGPPTPVTLPRLDDGSATSADAATLDDKYLVGERIGRGGMGDVHVARDLDLGRDVALKTLPPERRADEALIRALIHEARLTGQLQHPNIIPVYELGLLSSGRVYYTMKLISETNLQDVLHALKVGDAAVVAEYTTLRLLHIFQRLCNALFYAHARGVVHRDVKPDNVLLGGYGEVQLMDWGIASIVGRPDLGHFGDLGIVAGTPQYMSPEQATGAVASLDGRSDLYSLGVILYEMLTLTLPIEIPASVSDPNEVAALKSGPIIPPHRRAPARRVPRELSQICMKALQVDREARHADARELWRAIEAHLEGTKEQERLRLRARRDAARGSAAAARFRALLEEADNLKARIEELDRLVNPWSPEAQRREVWDAKNRRRGLSVVIGQFFADAVHFLQRALGNDAHNQEARQALSDLYASRIRVAENEGDVGTMVYFADAHRDLWPEQNRVPGLLSIRSSPEGAQVYLFRAEEVAEELQFDDAHLLGPAPLHHLARPAGNYLMVGRLAGFRDEHQFVRVRSNELNQVMLLLSEWAEAVPMVGRVDEIARMHFQHRQLVDTGTLRAMLVSGPSGSGKGRLISAFSQFIDERPEAYLYLYAHCREPSRYVAFSALAGVLRHRLGVTPNDLPATVEARLHDLVSYAYFGAESHRDLPPDDAADVKQVAGLLARMPGLGATQDDAPPVGQTGLRASLFEVAMELFERLSARLPLIVVLRAVHFTDATSRAFFRDVMTRLSHCPIMMVATTDPAYVRSDLLGTVFHEHIEIPPLRAEAIAELLRELLRDTIDPSLSEAIHRHTQGHASAVEDIVGLLVQAKHITNDGGAYKLKPSGQALLAGQYDQRRRLEDRLLALGRPLQEALEAAAVVGQVFSAAALASMGVEDPRWALRSLVEAELVARRPQNDSLEGAEYRFVHVQVRRAILDLIDPERRALLHYAAARWIESMGVRGDAWKARLAIHLQGMGQPVYAAHLHAELAESATAVGAYDDANRNLRQAMALGTDPAFRASVGLRRLECLVELERFKEAGRAMDQLMPFVNQLPDDQRDRLHEVSRALGDPDRRRALEDILGPG